MGNWTISIASGFLCLWCDAHWSFALSFELASALMKSGTFMVCFLFKQQWAFSSYLTFWMYNCSKTNTYYSTTLRRQASKALLYYYFKFIYFLLFVLIAHFLFYFFCRSMSWKFQGTPGDSRILEIAKPVANPWELQSGTCQANYIMAIFLTAC